MQKPDKPRTPSPTTSATMECCIETRCESGLRNNYFEGKRLTPDMFRIEQRYLNERRHLLNRAIHGWGVVYGYALGFHSAKDGRQQGSLRLSVESGLALDQCGRELLQAGARTLDLDELIPIDDKRKRTDLDHLLPQAGSSNQKYWTGQKDRSRSEPVCALLSVHYAEQATDRVTINDPCRCERHEWDHACETVRYTVRVVPCDDGCTECDCELHCECGTGKCCEPEPDDKRGTQGKQADAHASDTQVSKDSDRDCLPFKRGGCRCMCDHLAELDAGGECVGGLCEIEEPCARVRVDLAHGVPIACLELVPDNRGGWTFGEDVNACGPRRLVKRNDLLFDLIRGCDLTRINEIGWSRWHRKEDAVKFDDFSAAFGGSAYGQDEYVTRDFWVKFSKPVRENTLLPDCFAMTVMSMEREGNWRQMQRVPIVRLEFFPAEPGDPPGHVRGAKVVVAGGWVEDALRGRASVFYADTWVEIEVRGDFILDCNGQPVDANAVGRLAAMTGNGTPGGTFLSTFSVALREPYVRPVAHDTQDSVKGAAS